MAEGEYRTGSDVRTGYITGNTFGVREVRYTVIDGKAIFEGDIVLGTVEEMERRAAAIAEGNEALEGLVITGAQFRWPGGVIPFVIDPALPDQGRVTQAIEHWNTRTPIRLIPHTNEPNFVTFSPGMGCSSAVGMQPSPQTITLGTGCPKGSVIHEIGHAVGLWHEQGREDRDRHIRVNLQNVEPGKAFNFDQHITDGDDVGPYDFGSIMHYDKTAFSVNGQPTIETLHGESIGQRSALSDGDLAAVDSMYVRLPVALPFGVYTMQQKSNGRFVDAHENDAQDFGVVTRPAQNNDTQKWFLRPVGGVYTIQQRSNNRFVDAHEHSGEDFGLVTRPAQNNDTQRWILVQVDSAGLFTIQQKSGGRFVDAHDTAANDFEMVTRTAQNDDTQRWVIAPARNGTFTLQQKSSGRFADAHEIAEKDFALVTRPRQSDFTQEWILTPIGTVCTIQQMSSGRYLDAYESSTNDFACVTRTAQHDDTQRWIVLPAANGTFTIQQKSNGRFVDAHEIEGRDFALVTRTAQNDDTQRWILTRV